MATGCVIKPYRAPQFQGTVDSLYRTLEMQVDTSVNTGQIHWKEFFTDSLLRGYIAKVLERNHDLQYSRKNLEIAYAQLRSARASIAPTVGPASLTGNSAVNTHGLGASPVTGALSLGASWEIDLWGKLLSSKRAAQATLMATREGVQALQTALVAQTAGAYYQLVTLDMERRITLETIENRAQYLDTIRIMKNSGKVNEIAVQQAVAQLGDVQAALPNIELSIIKTENALSTLMGATYSPIARVHSINIHDARIMADIGVPAQLISFRPDVRAAEQQYRNAFELYNVSRAAMYPSLSISANGNISDLFNSHFGTLNLLAGLTQPIFNARRLRTQKEVADLSAQQSEINFQKTVLAAGQEVSNALAAQIKTQERGKAQKLQLDAYIKAYDYSFELFVNGYATYLDVLTAQTGVFNTQISLLETYYSNTQARIELYRALGGGAEAQLTQQEIIEMAKSQTEQYKEAAKKAKKQK